MRFLSGLNSSVSRIVLSIFLGVAIVGNGAVMLAVADVISYDDTDNSAKLQTAPSFLGGASNYLYVGDLNNSSAFNNVVTVDYTDENKAAPGFVFGGLTASGNAQNNRVEIKNGQVNSVYGAYSHYNATVSNNSVMISGGSVADKVYGAYSTDDSKVINNSVTITGGSVNSTIYGGYNNYTYSSTSSTVANNIVTISDGMIGGNVYGGYTFGVGSLVNSNHVFVTGGTIKGNISGASGGSLNTISDNSVTVSGGNVSGNVIGGDNNHGEDSLTVINNSVTVSAGTIGGSVYGGYSYSLLTKNTGNSVKVTGGTISGDVYGTFGYAGVVTNNRVEISGGTIEGNIYGGYSSREGFDDSSATMTGNHVILVGDQMTLGKKGSGGTQYSSIWGGRVFDSQGTEITDFDKVVADNTLNLKGFRGTVSGIYNFENYNWILPANVRNGDTLVTIADNGQAVNITSTKHNISMVESDLRLKGGDTITMISATVNGTYATSNHIITQGQFVVYDATLAQKDLSGSDSADSGNPNTTEGRDLAQKDSRSENVPLVLTINDPADPNKPAAQLNPQSQSYLEGRAGALAFINQANDLIATAGIDKVRFMLYANDEAVRRPAIIPFTIMGGFSQVYKADSHVDIRGVNVGAGFAAGYDFAAGHKATLGVFFEYGHGTYDTYNSFSRFASVHGNGDSKYQGGGFFSRVDFAGTGLGRATALSADKADGVYVEASIRAGRISSLYEVGGHMRWEDDMAYRGSYDSRSTYLGGHAAGGYVFNFDSKHSFDLYGRYLWTRMNANHVTITNERLDFAAANSGRVQIGGRYGYDYSKEFKPYIGAAYEREFGGAIKAQADEFKLVGPSLVGSVGIFEVGFTLQPIASNDAFTVNFNGQGYAGVRQGGGGSFKLKYQF